MPRRPRGQVAPLKRQPRHVARRLGKHVRAAVNANHAVHAGAAQRARQVARATAQIDHHAWSGVRIGQCARAQLVEWPIAQRAIHEVLVGRPDVS